MFTGTKNADPRRAFGVVIRRAVETDAERLTAPIHASGAYRGRYATIIAS
ncbi:hypothetical protein [Streptomyces neyagawaensis]|nr:hypothetical protein [Streptomyces neyagawaensis]MCL6731263.1 hypothetical protein [Streptomyces neyagawaensis]MDE1683613.1 hypothetical protein [Streptomyces neyagawaensis]